jgi:hypothetical protein
MHATHTTALRERMRQELQLAGLSERTQEAYLRAVRQLATHSQRPDQIIDAPQHLLFDQLRDVGTVTQACAREAAEPGRGRRSSFRAS